MTEYSLRQAIPSSDQTSVDIMAAKTTYPLSAVSKVLGVSEDDLTNWARRGQLEGIISHGRGRERHLTTSAVFRASIIKRCQDFGIHPNRSSEWANKTLLLMSTFATQGKLLQLTQVVIRQYEDDEETVLPNDDLLKKKPRPGALVTLIIEFETIVRDLHAKLDTVTRSRD